MKAKIAYTYGWTDAYISKMPYRRLLTYWKAITPIEAQQALTAMDVASFPHLKKSGIDKLVKKYNEMAYLSIDTKRESVSIEELAKQMALKLGGG